MSLLVTFLDNIIDVLYDISDDIVEATGDLREAKRGYLTDAETLCVELESVNWRVTDFQSQEEPSSHNCPPDALPAIFCSASVIIRHLTINLSSSVLYRINLK